MKSKVKPRKIKIERDRKYNFFFKKSTTLKSEKKLSLQNPTNPSDHFFGAVCQKFDSVF